MKQVAFCWCFGRHPIHDQLLLDPPRDYSVGTSALLEAPSGGCVVLARSLRVSLVGRWSRNVSTIPKTMMGSHYMVVMLVGLLVNRLYCFLMSGRLDYLAGDSWLNSVCNQYLGQN